MKRKVVLPIALIALAAGAAVYYARRGRTENLTLTGIVTTDDVVVSSQVSGRLEKLLVKEGDTVSGGQLLAVIAPQELRADSAFYSHSAEGSAAQVEQARAALTFEEAQTRDQIRQAEATLASTEAQVKEAQADLENARLNYERTSALFKQGIVAAQANDQARTTYQAAESHEAALAKQVQAAEAAVALARANADQVRMRRAALETNLHQLAAAGAQKQKAQIVLGYTEIHSPVGGTIDVRAALQGEVVNPAQPIVSLIDPDNLWVRIDVPETYIDQIRLGEQLPVRLPSGVERSGTLFFRGVDASYATQRDVSRTKRDIKTFEVRLRVDNRDRALEAGMTAYVTVPIASPVR